MNGHDEAMAALVTRFRSIAVERIARLNNGLVALGREPDEATSAEVLREIHTLKGESRMLGLMDVSDVAHATEDLLLFAKAHGFQMEAALVDLVLEGLDLAGALAAEGASLDPDAAPSFTRRARAYAQGDEAPKPRRKPRSKKPAGQAPKPAAAAKPAADAPPPADASPDGEAAARRLMTRQSEHFVRVPQERLTELTRLVADLVLRQVRAQASFEALADAALDPGGNPVAARRRLERALARRRDDLFLDGLHAGELEDAVRRIRLLPLSTLFSRYPEAIRDLAREQGKKVQVEVRGGDLSVDKQVLDEIEEPLIHLVRNAVDHGIEDPESRRGAGKRAHGTVRLLARQDGGRVVIVLEDDGAGIDPDRVREAAIARGLVTREAAARLSPDEARALVFAPGFSTRETVTDLSGRGVGLDVVRANVERLGGSVELESRPGAGTRIALSVPVSVALSRIFVVRAGGAMLSVPAFAVEAAVVLPRAELMRAGDGLAFAHDGRRVGLARLSELLGLPVAPDGEAYDVVVLAHEQHRLGLVVDGFAGERTAVQQPLPAFLEGIGLVTGTVALEGGAVAMTLSVAEVLRAAGEMRRGPVARAAPGGEHTDTVLLVDDAELTRDTLVAILRRPGLRIVEAVNGEDAIGKIADAAPDLVVTDLDMPLMDGFSLIAALRARADTAEVPILVLSTRGSDADKRRAMQAGANAYLVKSDFREKELERTVSMLLGRREVASAG